MQKNLLAIGNQKLGNKVLTFNLPVLKTCKPTQWCRKHCYANKGRFGFKQVKQSLEWKLEESKKDNFVEQINLQLKRSKKKLVRIHASGDFYSNEYVNRWIEIAKANPDKIFVTYTKRDDLQGVLKELESLPNVKLFGSIDETKIKTPFKKFAAIEGTPVTDSYRTCDGGCEKCKYKCWSLGDNVVFHKH